MKFKINVILFLAWNQVDVYAIEYIYPICAEQDKIFYVYQKSLTDAELWRYFLKTKSQLKCLDWRYMPAGVKLLPDNNSFSFVDTGRLRIKDFNKRSVHTVEFDQPVYGVSEINWIDNNLCYFSAKQKEHFGIFWGEIKQGKITQFYQTLDTECLSPRIIERQLFCIERNSKDRSCRIISKALNDADTKLILECGYQQVIFLQMLTANLGFYIEHMPYINSESELVTFICHKIELNQNQQWSATNLFRFNILKKHLFGNDRLYESLTPFLPRAKKTALYFSDIERNQQGEYYSLIKNYNLTTGKYCNILRSNSDMLFFAPLIVNNDQLVYGKITNGSFEERSLGFMKI